MFQKVLYSNPLFFSADNVVMQQVTFNVSNLVCNELFLRRNPTCLVHATVMLRMMRRLRPE